MPQISDVSRDATSYACSDYVVGYLMPVVSLPAKLAKIVYILRFYIHPTLFGDGHKVNFHAYIVSDTSDLLYFWDRQAKVSIGDYCTCLAGQPLI